MEKTILRKRDISGQTVDVRLRETSPGSFALQVFVDGYFVSGPAKPVALEEPRGSITHYLGGGYGDRPVIGLTDVEAELIERALERAAHDSGPLPSQQRRILVARRRDLMEEYRRLLQRRDAEYEAAQAAGRGDAEQLRQAYEARMATAQAAIKSFDRQYPDIVEAAMADLPEDAE